jgi:hypothetical protein
VTHEELDALPEVGGFGQREEMRDGRKVTIPVAERSFALFHGPDDPLSVEDRNGSVWMVGWAGGVRYKQRVQRWSST